MDYGGEATQLFFVVILLVVAYFGVMIWTRRVNKRQPGEGVGGSGRIAGGGAVSAADTDYVDETGTPAGKEVANRRKGRFQLQGKDAEVAAKVLKRMLSQDPGFKGQGHNK